MFASSAFARYSTGAEALRFRYPKHHNLIWHSSLSAPMTAKPPGPTTSRRYPRFPMDVRVSAKVFRTDAPIELWGRSIEFGQDGIGVTLTGELDAGEVATLELTLPASSIP